jgi:subtilisin family serine protease
LGLVVSTIHQADIVLVVAGGNDNEDLDSDYLTIQGGHTEPTIVVGGVDNAGVLWRYSPSGDKVSVYAQSVLITVADHTGDNSYRGSSGTSYACAAVAGLAATFLSDSSLAADLNVQGEVAKRVKWMIGANAQSRLLPSPAIGNIATNGHTLTETEKDQRAAYFADFSSSKLSAKL